MRECSGMKASFLFPKLENGMRDVNNENCLHQRAYSSGTMGQELIRAQG